MKRILTLILGLSVVGSIAAMEAPQQEIINIEYKGPQFNPHGNLYQICAFNNNKMIGYITYSLNTITNSWQMGTLSVQKPFRRLTIAKKLFKQCIEHLQMKGISQLEVQILSLDTSISLEQLEEIYKKIVQSLALNNAEIIAGQINGNSLVKMRTATLKWNNS